MVRPGERGRMIAPSGRFADGPCVATSVSRPRLRPRHVATTGTDANSVSQYVPGGNTAAAPARQRSRALAYSIANNRLRSSASTRAHLLRLATPGRRLRRGSRLPGRSCGKTRTGFVHKRRGHIAHDDAVASIRGLLLCV
jgi:hypothetical protein